MPDFGNIGTRTITVEGFKVDLDLTSQILLIDAPIDRDYRFGDNLYAGSVDAPLSATLNTMTSPNFVSAAVLAQKAKVFDDGLYASVELAAQEGVGRHGGKALLLTSLCEAFIGTGTSYIGPAQEMLLAAAGLGNLDVSGIPAQVEACVQRVVTEFLADDSRSKPIGFYTWTRSLERIFRQDRMLQSVIADRAGIAALASALQADTSARSIYERQLRLMSGLTNPFACPDLSRMFTVPDSAQSERVEQDVRFFPPSAAHETELVKRLYGNRPIPAGFVLADEMIRHIRSRLLDLTPRTESGWYDYQTWALEPLVIPEFMAEGSRLELTDKYKKVLLELFKGLMALSRETHIKQLETAMAGCSPWGTETTIDIAPELSAEPLATFYLRRALGYRFVRGVLEETFGPGQLERLHGIRQEGPVQKCLAEELFEIETLFFGAHASVAAQLGLAPDAAAGSSTAAGAAADRFAAWARDLRSDPDLCVDLRTMVPVFYDMERWQTKVWAFLGWSSRPITLNFARTPQATVQDLVKKPPRAHQIQWSGRSASLPYPVTAELYVNRVLDREEFRALCNACGKRSAIIRRLGSM